ncbi:MAG: DUF4417 domain-containing protein [Lentisphaerae bacterium]|nr:DUF4417 domain-containing protein [Lentisphaerota bacterium]
MNSNYGGIFYASHIANYLLYTNSVLSRQARLLLVIHYARNLIKGTHMQSRKEYELDKIYKLSYVDLSKFVGRFQIPKLKRICCLPKTLINFKDAMKHNKFNAFVHFYLNDGEFECLWRNPERYINRLKKFNGVLTPDFSLYTDMPLAIQIWNVYRSRLMGIVFEQNGIKVIPTISWADSRSFDFAFDGIPKHDVVSVSSVGIWKDKKVHHLFLKGLSAMIQELQPACIVFYGKLPAYNFGSISIIQQDPDTFFWKKNSNSVYYKEI